MKNTPYLVVAPLAVFFVSCLTINIYFPAEEVRAAANRIVQETWGTEKKEGEPATSDGASLSGIIRHLFALKSAHAEQDINVSTPEIRAIKYSIKKRSPQIKPYLGSGHIGLTSNGLVALRSSEGLDLKSRAEAAQLVKKENQDRKRLYQEIAKANRFPDKAGDIQGIFAKSWRDQASRGWYLQGIRRRLEEKIATA